jgi:hypothetical protein
VKENPLAKIATLVAIALISIGPAIANTYNFHEIFHQNKLRMSATNPERPER